MCVYVCFICFFVRLCVRVCVRAYTGVRRGRLFACQDTHSHTYTYAHAHYTHTHTHPGTVTSFYDGRSVVEHIREKGSEAFDCMLLDLCMPDMGMYVGGAVHLCLRARICTLFGCADARVCYMCVKCAMCSARGRECRAYVCLQCVLGYSHFVLTRLFFCPP